MHKAYSSPVSSPLASRRTTSSVWSATERPSRTSPLRTNARADVCIVGAGIAGLTTAYLLAREGRSVIVLDKNKIGHGETSQTSAHLSNEIDAGYRRIERLHGEKGARLVAQSHTSAIARIESIVSDEEIDCDFERLNGYLFLGDGNSKEVLSNEFEAARRAGIKVEKVERPPSNLPIGPSLRFREQAQFHPLRYMAGLAAAIKRRGGRIFSETEMAELKGGKTVELKTKTQKKISSASVVVATNTPVNDWVKMHAKQAAYRSYVIGVPVPAGSIPKALYWDTEDPFHYVRLLRTRNHGQDADLLMIGGEDHKTGQAAVVESRFGALLAWGRNHFPNLTEPKYFWSGQVMNSIDGLAFIGHNPDDEGNVYIATGDSGMGLTHGTIAGILIKDLILGRLNPWAGLYDPSRRSLRAALHFAEENLNVAAQYTDWITPGEVRSRKEIKRRTGAVVRNGFSKVAVYRDDAGKFHERSAVCPHLGCIVSWNATEGSWDCPCHGSRFAPSGKVLNGPAIGPLNAAKPSR